MDNFIVSARKYRPATFEMVVGQESITNTLRNAILNRHLAQAYLFCGPRGVGKTTCARIFAKTINCYNLSETGDPCDKCESCLSFNSLRSFNIHELDAASNNKVDDIRSLTDQVRIPPQVGKYSIYIIDEVHMLSSSAFNAFLKTLEEPPAHAIFILATTEKHKIIPTILSRCQIFDFKRIRVEDIVTRLAYVASKEDVTFEEKALHIIAQKADGALRDALSIFDQIISFSGKNIQYEDVINNLNVLDYEYYFRAVDYALAADISKILIAFNEVLEKGFDGHNYIAGLSSHLRDLLVSKDTITLKLLEAAPSVKQRYADQASKCEIGFLYKALDICNSCDLSYKSSKNPRLLVELALIRMCGIDQANQPGDQKKKSIDIGNELISTEVPEIKKKPEPRVEPEPGPAIASQQKARDSRPAELTTKEPGSVSIREYLSGDNKAKVADPVNDSKDPYTIKDGVSFSEAEFMKLWKDFSDEHQSDGPRATSMFKSIKPEIHPDNSVTLHLSNAAQKDFFHQNYKQRLQNLVDNKFSEPEIKVDTFVDMAETNGIIYSDEQKYTYLSTKYPAIKEFRKAFNLDFE
ncbi:MAG: DNA polymerase III subunit gamma/tau [Bacteroidales bacterium]